MIRPLELLDLVALIALGATGLTLIVRRVPPVSRWVAAGVKPFACNVCCATWTTLALSLVAVAWSGVFALVAWLPALGLATWLLQQADPPSPAFVLPEEPEP